jgi:hypothetical protein
MNTENQLAEVVTDLEKLEVLADEIDGIGIPAMTTEAGQKAASEIAEQVAKFARYIRAQAAKLGA